MGMGSGSGMGMGMGRLMRNSEEDVPKVKITKELLFRIGRYYLPYWPRLILMILAIFVISSLGLVGPLLTRNIIDKALPEMNMSLLAYLTVISFGATVLGGLISVGENYLNIWVSKHIIFDIKNKMYNHLQYMSLRFFSITKTGDIISRLNNDVSGIERVFSGTVIQILQHTATLVLTATTLVLMNWKLAILALIIPPLFIYPTKRVGQTRWRLATKTQEKLAELNTIVHETLNISGAMLIKICTREKYEYKRFQGINRDIIGLQIRESIVGRWFRMVISSFSQLGPNLIFFYGGYLFIQGEVTIGDIVAFATLLNRLYGPVAHLSGIHIEIARSMALFERIFEYLDMEHEIKDQPKAIAIPTIQGKIEFENVHFSYTEDQTTLKNINFTIEPGQVTALVGLSGSGKTTITYLISRLYQPNGGDIKIDGISIADITLESLRSQIGIVTQDTYVFNASVKENLRYSKAEATDEELVKACEIANIHSFITDLPEGYDTIVGERGMRLSGGEKQRLSIARAVLKDPRILIFDEATSSLDSMSEVLIQDAIEPLLEGRTSIVIAHRLSTIMAADQILVLEDGEIMESGTHEQLVSHGGLYESLCEKQFRYKKPSVS